jgi:hypothetical protein
MISVDIDALSIDIDGEAPVFRLNRLLFTGEVVEQWKGRIASQFEVVNGYKHGEEFVYDNDGNLESVKTYKDGVLHGEVKHFEYGKITELANSEFGICVEAGNVSKSYSVESNEFDSAMLALRRKQR